MNAVRSLVCAFATVLAIVLAQKAALLADELVIRPEPSSGVIEVGQPIAWQIEWRGESAPEQVSYVVERGGRTEIDRGTLKLVDGRSTLTKSLDSPGTLLAEVTARAVDGKEYKALGGAIVAPMEIRPSAPRPEDFDAFWEAKIREIAATPANAKLEKVESGREGVDYWKITLDGYKGSKIHGQLAMPASAGLKSGKKLPALMIPQWAGVYPLEKPWVTDRAAEGWLVLNILAHDLPIDESAKFYEEQSAGPLKDYWVIGNDDRDTSYYLRMYLSCYQATEYLTSRPDWDGETLVVMGASQGGLQSLVTAAIHPRVTAALALVPAGCDMLGPEVGRSPGWPKWYDCIQGKDAAKVRAASRYYDVVNFAPRIECPVLVAFGLIDQVCPPEGILAAVNEIKAPKETVILPLSEHQEIDGSQRAYYDRAHGGWLPALREGKAAPIRGEAVSSAR